MLFKGSTFRKANGARLGVIFYCYAEGVAPVIVCPPLWCDWEALPSQSLRFIEAPRLSLGPEGSGLITVCSPV